jgi:RNA-splicing ligase RtcB
MLDKDDFFSVGRPKPVARQLQQEETKDWKDIKPSQSFDALNRQVFRKRKREEFEAQQAKKLEQLERTLPFAKRIKREPKEHTPLVSVKEQLEIEQKNRERNEEALKIKKFLESIQKVLGASYEQFKVSFATYK